MQPVFSERSVTAFGESYPLKPLPMKHELVDHPLLRIEAMEALARAMNPADLEHNAAVGLKMGIASEDVPSNNMDVYETIRSIDRCGSWVLLKKVQQVPAYAKLLDDALEQLSGHILPETGRIMRPDAYLFISSPEAITPLHFDPDYNILNQIRGSKTMTLYPAEDPEIAPQWFKERYYSGGTRNLPWEERFAPRGTPHRLDPGDALYVPILAPHYVQVVGDDISISLSLTWRSVWSHHQADTHRLNTRLRKLGMNPPPPRAYPQQNMMKSVAWRVIERVEGTLKRAG